MCQCVSVGKTLSCVYVCVCVNVCATCLGVLPSNMSLNSPQLFPWNSGPFYGPDVGLKPTHAQACARYVQRYAHTTVHICEYESRVFIEN